MKNYEITEEQIKELAKGNAKVKKWFPEVFETNTLNKRVVVEDKKFTFNALVYDNGEPFIYGFNHGNEWSIPFNIYNVKTFCKSQIRLATDSEVLEALKNEAIKRGYKKGNYKCLTGLNTYTDIEDNFFIQDGYLWEGKIGMANKVFDNGTWATIIPTYTKKEAEKMLNAKII